MKKIKVVEVNNIDLVGKRFNGYDLQVELNKKQHFDIKQLVVHKMSKDKNVITLLDPAGINFMQKLSSQEDLILSTQQQISITSPALLKNKYYRDSNIVHIHMFHNSKLSLYSLLEIATQKKVVLSLHDPWFITGRCVHPFECAKWKNGCGNCEHLDTMFTMKKDNTASLWKLKKNIFDNIQCDLIVSTKWMENLVKQSPILKKQRVHCIPFGINIKEFSPVSLEEQQKIRKKYNISKDDIVLFFRAQNAFKGTNYIKEALEMLNSKKNIVIFTCDQKGLLKDLESRYKIIELGVATSNQILEIDRICDMFLMPSLGESFGYMAIEAMACKKTVVIFDNSALPSVTFAPECGVLVNNKDSKALKEAIEMLINNPSEREKRGILGRKIVEENYNIEDYHKKIEELYLNLQKEQRNKQKINYPKETNKEKDIEILKKRLRTINNTVLTKKTKQFSFLKRKRVYLFDKNYEIDYSNYEVQKLLKQYNEMLYTNKNEGEEHHPLKTAISLLIHDPKKFIVTCKEKLLKK